MFLKFINFPIFIIAFIIGLIFIHISMPDEKTVYVYPTPNNINSIEYKDITDNCFEFEYQEVDCAKYVSKIKHIPLQN